MLELSAPQSAYYTSTAKYTAAVAGFGSGKTLVTCSRMLATMIRYPDIDLAYLAPTYPLINDIFYPCISELLDNHNISHAINQQKHIVTIQGLGKILCRTMEKPNNIIGFEVGDAFLDEFDTLAKDKALAVFRKISARLRQKFPDSSKQNQLFISTTPEGFKATYELFQKDPLPNSNLIQMSTYTNKHLPKDYISSLEAQYPSQLIKAYLNGEFVNLTSGTIYYNFNRYTCNSSIIEVDKEDLHFGMDFNVYKMAAIGHVIRQGVKIAVKEYIDLRDTPDVIQNIKEDYPNHRIFVYPDAAGKGTDSKSATVSDISLLRKAGFYIKAKNSNPRIKNRVASLNNIIEKGLYKVNITRCPRLTESLEQQVYDGNTSKPEKEGDLEHRNDAVGYLAHYLHPINKPSVSMRTH